MTHTILVIDDQWSMQEYARTVLQAAGYRVLLASDGLTGLSLVRAEHPDAVVVDQHMPGADSEDFLRGLHQDASTADIPVIVITLDRAGDAGGADALSGPASYLQKPFAPPTLVWLVERVIHEPELPMAV